LHSQKKDLNILTIGTSADYHPFSFRDEQGAIAGFDIDLITHIAHSLGKTVQFEDRPFNSLILELLGNQIDVIAAACTPTEDRKKHVLFTNNYFEGDAFIALSKQPINSLDELLQKRIITNTGYAADLYISNYNLTHELIKLKSPSEALLALQSNAGDAFVTAKNSIQKFLASQHNYYIFELPIAGDCLAFAVAPNNQELCNQINKILVDIKADGSLQALLKKWKIS
jgi:polar amino acid transport system substrate-binding protein